MSQAAKTALRQDLEAIQRDLSVLKNRQMMLAVDEVIKATKLEVGRLVSAGRKSAVLRVDVGSDAKALKRATDEIKKSAADLSFLGVSAEQDKITVFAVASDEAQAAGLKANEWVTAAIAAYGGRGGGKPGLAQGSTAEAGKLEAVMADAEKFLDSKSFR